MSQQWISDFSDTPPRQVYIRKLITPTLTPSSDYMAWPVNQEFAANLAERLENVRLRLKDRVRKYGPEAHDYRISHTPIELIRVWSDNCRRRYYEKYGWPENSPDPVVVAEMAARAQRAAKAALDALTAPAEPLINSPQNQSTELEQSGPAGPFLKSATCVQTTASRYVLSIPELLCPGTLELTTSHKSPTTLSCRANQVANNAPYLSSSGSAASNVNPVLPTIHNISSTPYAGPSSAITNVTNEARDSSALSSYDVPEQSDYEAQPLSKADGKKPAGDKRKPKSNDQGHQRQRPRHC